VGRVDAQPLYAGAANVPGLLDEARHSDARSLCAAASAARTPAASKNNVRRLHAAGRFRDFMMAL
jgi:hypothetical protein